MTRPASGRQAIGAQGEDLAAAHLVAQGWELVARNWRCAVGEIDIIAVEPDGTTVFCEVKSRTGTGFGDPLEAITYEKERKLRQLAATWLDEHHATRVRLDAIGIVLRVGHAPRITHVRGL
ncbi:YraN family protein [Microlunatus sp. Y2014]|uniref:YraN family protein n=1 Tax=Microlunatus sp. Y2014 TaxID=3418488 RepID=UPI003DA74694